MVVTRGSLLARRQTEQTVAQLQVANPGYNFEIITLSTQGDRQADRPLTSFGGTGVFVKELEIALLNKEADIAIHSTKDVPGKIPEKLLLASFPPRENPYDVLLTRDSLPVEDYNKKLVIGTGSPRRIIQLQKLFPNAIFKDLRGNIGTRLNKLSEGQYDAIVIAAAGLIRLGIQIPQHAFLSIEHCLPSVGQGAIAIQCRADDKRVIDLVSKVNDKETEIAIRTERAFLSRIEGGCKFPLAAFAQINEDMISFDALAGDGKTGRFVRIKNTADISGSYQVAIETAEELLENCKKQNIILFD